MAKISTYTIDSVIEGNDKLLGTDSASTSALATRNYTIDSLKAFINLGSPANIVDTIPLGFALTVNREGSAYDPSSSIVSSRFSTFSGTTCRR